MFPSVTGKQLVAPGNGQEVTTPAQDFCRQKTLAKIVTEVVSRLFWNHRLATPQNKSVPVLLEELPTAPPLRQVLKSFAFPYSVSYRIP